MTRRGSHSTERKGGGYQQGRYLSEIDGPVEFVLWYQSHPDCQILPHPVVGVMADQESIKSTRQPVDAATHCPG